MNLGRTIAALVVPIVFIGASSQVIACLDDLKAPGDPSDAGDDGALGCGHATPPLPPTVADDPSNDVTFVTAMRSVRLESGPQDAPLGLDLDRFCTCQGEAPTCVAPAQQQNEELQCDGPEGRDSMSQVMFQLFGLLLSLDGAQGLEQLCSEFANLGRWSVLMRVSGYNGLPDDPNVRVDWLPSYGMAIPPAWDGSDVWPVAANAMDPDGGPRYFDPDAYVKNGSLVFSLPEADFQMGNGNVTLAVRFSSGTTMATIEKNEKGQYQLRNGLLAGRIPLDDLFKMATAFRDHNGVPFCANAMNPFYDATRNAICQALDIQVGSPQPNKACDALSLAIAFDADSIANAGPLEAPPAVQMNCPPGEDPYSVFLNSGCPLPFMLNAN